VNNLKRQVAAAAGASAVVAGVAIGALTLSNQSTGGFSAEPADPVAPTATIQTTQVAPSEPEVEKAEPQITGPAPLPPEDQGLPG
jgi:hypothetical protein